MLDLLNRARQMSRSFLTNSCPGFRADWWRVHVVDRLSFPAAKNDRGARHHVTEAGWIWLRCCAWWIKIGSNFRSTQMPARRPELGQGLQTVRNKWRHVSSAETSFGEIYRDADTLCRVLNLIGARSGAIESVEPKSAGR